MHMVEFKTSLGRILRRYFPHLFVLTLLAVVTYLPYIGGLGFYHDDWQFIFARSAGQDIKFFFSVDRPFMGTILAKSAVLLGYQPLFWHLFAFLARLAGGFTFYLLAESILPQGQHRLPALLAGSLFLIYPGFLMQPSAVSYVPHLLALFMAIFSLYLTLKSLEIRQSTWQARFVTAVLVILSAGLVYPYLAILEYFIGLEGVRLLLLISRLEGWKEKRVRRGNFKILLSRLGLPYLAAAAFLYWRFWIFVPRRVAVDSTLVLDPFIKQPFAQSVEVLVDLANSLLQTFPLAYITPWIQRFSMLTAWQVVLNLALALATGGACWWFLRNGLEHPATGWHRRWVGLGVLMIVIPLLPPVILGRPVNLTTDYNRYTLQSIPGLALALVGAIYWLKSSWRKVTITLLVTLSILTQLNNGARHVRVWQVQQAAWQQLALRVPQLEQDTILVLNLPVGYQFPEGFEITAIANLIYAPDFPANPQQPVIVGEILNEITIPLIQSQQVYNRYTKTVPLELDYRRLLIVSQPVVDSCLHLISDPALLSGSEPALIRQSARYSHLTRVVLEGSGTLLPAGLFGSSRKMTWCSLYQQADLALQQSDWQKIVRLAEQGEQNNLAPADVYEWLPFYRAYQELGDLQHAEMLFLQLQKDPGLVQNYCASPGSESGALAALCSQ